MSCDIKQQLVGRDAVGVEHEDVELRLVFGIFKRGEFSVESHLSGVVCETSAPNHAADIAAAPLWLATLLQLSHDSRCGGGDVGVGVSFEQFFESGFELVVVFLRNVR